MKLLVVVSIISLIGWMSYSMSFGTFRDTPWYINTILMGVLATGLLWLFSLSVLALLLLVG